MKIYFADIRELEKGKNASALLENITEERRRNIEKCHRWEDKLRGLGAGLLLEYGLNIHGLSLLPEKEYRQVFLETGENGKPHLRNGENICFNLSHSGDYVAAVFATSAVGIDVERPGRSGEKIAKRYFQEEEQRYLAEQRWESCREKKFTELWTRKESYVKAVGEGLRMSMRSFSVLGRQVRYAEGEERDEEYFLRTYEMPEGYCLSVCAKVPVKAEPEKISFYMFDGTGENQYNKNL